VHKTKEEGGEAVRVKTIYISDLDEEYWKELQEKAKKDKRSVSFIVNILVRDYIRKGRQNIDNTEGGAQE
jgi:hypothetical protein